MMSPGQRPNISERADKISLEGIKVLIIDDMKDVRESTEHALQAWGATVIAVEDTTEGESELQQFPDILIIDNSISRRGDGIQFIREKTGDFTGGIILLTGEIISDPKFRCQFDRYEGEEGIATLGDTEIYVVKKGEISEVVIAIDNVRRRAQEKDVAGTDCNSIAAKASSYQVATDRRNFASKSILIVENNISLLSYCKERLSPYYTHIYSAATKKEASDILGKHVAEIACVISEVLLNDGGSGIDFLIEHAEAIQSVLLYTGSLSDVQLRKLESSVALYNLANESTAPFLRLSKTVVSPEDLVVPIDTLIKRAEMNLAGSRTGFAELFRELEIKIDKPNAFEWLIYKIIENFNLYRSITIDLLEENSKNQAIQGLPTLSYHKLVSSGSLSAEIHNIRNHFATINNYVGINFPDQENVLREEIEKDLDLAALFACKSIYVSALATLIAYTAPNCNVNCEERLRNLYIEDSYNNLRSIILKIVELSSPHTISIISIAPFELRFCFNLDNTLSISQEHKLAPYIAEFFRAGENGSRICKLDNYSEEGAKSFDLVIQSQRI